MPIRLPKHNTCDLALKKRKVMNHHHWELSAAEDTIWQDEWLGGPLFAGRCFLEILSAFHYQSHLPVKSLLMLGRVSEALTLLA